MTGAFKKVTPGTTGQEFDEAAQMRRVCGFAQKSVCAATKPTC